eukprot:TRINITY_DN12278_c0_g1_i1.p1 TRINITY_DN12278_c0_g1~~TRINITY_DN12278_c0_g1_i1.p1  ORF type:complete len:180 (+),score=35.32 TRINITY_DN12278_c0_g1_i1:257-796(+)
MQFPSYFNNNTVSLASVHNYSALNYTKPELCSHDVTKSPQLDTATDTSPVLLPSIGALLQSPTLPLPLPLILSPTSGASLPNVALHLRYTQHTKKQLIRTRTYLVTRTKPNGQTETKRVTVSWRRDGTQTKLATTEPHIGLAKQQQQQHTPCKADSDNDNTKPYSVPLDCAIKTEPTTL